ncbi:MAG: glycosyltransferase family 39 protein [Bacteroidia bacterium]
MIQSRPFYQNHLLLLLILTAAAILRFWNYGELPYMHDEFSALNRLKYDSLSELIEKGIMPDGHPAGVQLFLYFWVSLVGNDEVWVKLPFVLCGILSVALLYLIGTRWFNPTTGLVAAAFLTALQYPVTYSQIARPYASGLFFTLLMVWGWTLFLFSQRKKTGWIIFVAGAVLCSYNHYFSHFMAIIAGFSGLFFVQRKDLVWYIAAGAAILVLYLPHFPIFLNQISIGGIGWLAAPRPDFFLDYFSYIFHHSPLVFLIVLVLVAGSLFFKKYKNSGVQFRFLSLCWFLLPLLTGYFYSIYFSPVLQYSVLLFSFPFLLLFLFSFLPRLESKWNTALISVILAVCIITLVFHRHHYHYFYHHTFKAVAEETAAAADSLGEENLSALLSANPDNIQFYFDEMNLRPASTHYLTSDIEVPKLKRILDSLSTPYVALGAMSAIPGEYLSIIRQQYPYMIKRKTGQEFEFYLYSKTESSVPGAQPLLFLWENDIESADARLRLDSSYLSRENSSSGNMAYRMDSTLEFGPAFRFSAEEIPAREGDLLTASIKIYAPDTPVAAVLALHISEGEKSIFWTHRPLMEYIRKPQEWQTAYLAINTGNTLWGPGKTMNIFIWNLKHEEFYLDDFKVEAVEGNRNRNILMEKRRKTQQVAR